MTAILVAMLSNPAVQVMIVGAVLTGTGWIGTHLGALIKAKADGTKYENGVAKIADAFGNAVMMVEQTMVPVVAEVLADGKVSPEEATRLRQAAWNSGVGVLGGDAGLDKLAKSMNIPRAQLELLLSQTLEALVYKLTPHDV